MTLSAGSRLGPYGIVSPLGAGGMGEVYRARDSRLNRDVAIKVVPDLYVGDVDRLARFRREAQVLASLNHSNIAQIYGFEDSDGVRALVMELVEGPTLADRIARGPIPLDEGLPIALQVAQALEAAHEQGVIHRDLKPANIKVREDGAVKVLDFGLAKALDPQAAASAANPMTSPTLSVHATQAGLILGTAAYMSPEQARGKVVDRRTDIWAFGVVLFEMLAGRRLFGGEEISDTLAELLKGEPDWHVLPSDVPPAVHRLLRRCLQKDPRQRLQHIGDARPEIEEVQRGTPPETGAPRGGVAWRERLAWASAIVVLGVFAAAAWRWGSSRPSDLPEMRVDITTPPTSAPTSFAISPDGRSVVFSAAGEDGPQMWLRSLNAGSARPLNGTQNGESPFWSPDGRSIGFFADNKLKRIDLDGGQPQILANVLTPAGGTWNQDGLILYVPADNGGVFRISATGTERSELIPRDKRPPGAMRFPQFLPDGRRFLFYASGVAASSGVYVGEVGSDKTVRLFEADGAAQYGSSHLLFVRQGTLMAQAFDPATLELRGSVTRLADDVTVGSVSRVAISTSAAGAVAYRTGAAGRRRFVWFDRSGKALGDASDALTTIPSNPVLSPDGRRLVIQMTVQNNIDLWLLELDRNVLTRLTLAPGIDSIPVWSPDGNRIVFNGSRNDVIGLYIKRMDGTGEDELFRRRTDELGPASACDWSPDGRFVLVRAVDPTNGMYDLWAISVEERRDLSPVVRTPYDERDGQFSPDGKWIAYQSDESGRPEIYVQPFPGPGPKVRVSTDGGTQVRWRQDGAELFYISPDNRLVSAAVSSQEPSRFHVAHPVPLFHTRIVGTTAIARQQYVVAANGRRFLINTAEETATAPITLVLNWKPAPEGR